MKGVIYLRYSSKSSVIKFVLLVSVIITLTQLNTYADSRSVKDETINDVLTIRDELKANAINSENIDEHRDDFTTIISNELGVDCITTTLTTGSIELSVDNELETVITDTQLDLEISNTKSNIDDLNETANEVVQVTSDYNDKVYTLPVQDVRDFKSGKLISVDECSIYLGSIQNVISKDIECPEWDTRQRFKDILIIKEVLVDQLGVSPSIASAIIGNICYEGSFASVENTNSSLTDNQEVISKLGQGDGGFGIAQWTSKFRQNKLKEYYNVASQDLDFKTASVVAECIYLYNELRASNLLGDMTKGCDIEDATGKLGYEYLAYANRSKEWDYIDGKYISNESPRYDYALKVYRWITSE